MTTNLMHTAITQLAKTGRVDPNTYSDLHTSARRTLAQQFGVRPCGTVLWPADARRDAIVELYLMETGS
jgi:hypothetical protein